MLNMSWPSVIISMNTKSRLIEVITTVIKVKKTMINARVEDWDSSDRLNTPTAITLYGTTWFDQAYSIIQFLLTANRLLDNLVSVSVDVDALAVRAGQVIEIQSDLITSGQGGRIVSVNAGARSITFDRAMAKDSGVRYELAVWHNNGTIERESIIGSYPDHQWSNGDKTITWSVGAWALWSTIPSADEIYAYGVAGTSLHKYRVTRIGRTNELTRALTLVQYDATLYESWTPPDGAPESEAQWNSSKIAIFSEDVETQANLLNQATNLQLQEVLSENKVTGEYESTIVATWDTVQGDPRGTWEVYFRDVDASDVDWEGVWEDLGAGYSEGDKVIRGGKAYISLANENITVPVSIDA